jgi:hypothetical protein
MTLSPRVVKWIALRLGMVLLIGTIARFYGTDIISFFGLTMEQVKKLGLIVLIIVPFMGASRWLFNKRKALLVETVNKE